MRCANTFTAREETLVAIEPDWLNAATCIENMQIAYDDATQDEDETPVDTVVSAGDLGVLIGLAEYAVRIAAPVHSGEGKCEQTFLATIVAAAPNAEPIIVRYNPDGSGWSVYDRAKHPARFFAETPTDDTRALVIAARTLVYDTANCVNPDTFRALDRALERYASSIAWDDEPETVELPPLHAHDPAVDQIAARMAEADGLDWNEACGFDTEAADCNSSTCVAAHYEDHDADCARGQYRKYARAALGIVQPVPIRCPDAEATQRFAVGDTVSHNAGLIDAHSKRQITAVLGYERNGGVQYRLALPGGGDQGMAYDCELDPWPGDTVSLPKPSPRAARYRGGK